MGLNDGAILTFIWFYRDSRERHSTCRLSCEHPSTVTPEDVLVESTDSRCVHSAPPLAASCCPVVVLEVLQASDDARSDRRLSHPLLWKTARRVVSKATPSTTQEASTRVLCTPCSRASGKATEEVSTKTQAATHSTLEAHVWGHTTPLCSTKQGEHPR